VLFYFDFQGILHSEFVPEGKTMNQIFTLEVTKTMCWMHWNFWQFHITQLYQLLT